MSAKFDPIVTKLQKFVSRFSLIRSDQLIVYVCWILHTWQFSERCHTPETTPYLYVNSKQKGSGKTVLGKDIVEVLARNPMGVNNVTEATLFHLCAMRSTIMIDEVDQYFVSKASNKPVVSVLNSGYRRGGKVPRMVKGEVELFPTFCPKSLIGINNMMLADTTRDRCVPITLEKHDKEELTKAGVVPLYNYQVADEIEEFGRELHAWALDHTNAIHDYDPKPVEGMTSGREWELARPLLQIAHAAGCEKELAAALIGIFNEERLEESVSLAEEAIVVMHGMFTDQNTDKLSTREILVELAEANDQMMDWNGKKLGLELAPWAIKAGPIRRGNQVDRGYKLSSCVKAFKALGLDIPEITNGNDK